MVCRVVLLRDQNGEVVPARDVAVRLAEGVEGGVEVVLLKEEAEIFFFFLREREEVGGKSDEQWRKRRRPGDFRWGTSLLSSPCFCFLPSRFDPSPHLRDQVAAVIEHLEACSADAKGPGGRIHFFEMRDAAGLEKQKERKFLLLLLSSSPFLPALLPRS